MDEVDESLVVVDLDQQHHVQIEGLLVLCLVIHGHVHVQMDLSRSVSEVIIDDQVRDMIIECVC